MKVIQQISVADVKSHLSEYIAKVAFSHKRFIITKRNKPIAALVDINDLMQVENAEETKGLASIIGKWKNFDDISENVSKTYKSRQKDKLRNVSI
jgi:prevent-host-death family protein